MPFFAILGPRDAGPGERDRMLEAAAKALEESGVDDHVRIDVPGRGAGEAGDGNLREPVHLVVPALQSGSLFGGGGGVLVVDAENLQKAEAEVIAELVAAADADHVTGVFVAAGSIPAPLGKLLKERGSAISIKKMRERDASDWLGSAARERGIRLDSDGVEALLHRFGSDVASLGRVLDQLAVSGEDVTAEEVRDRFRNRPDEPMWYYADAISAGDEGEALRRLEDFLEHEHPLVLLAFLEGEVRKRSLAAVAPDVETYASWVGSQPSAFPVRKIWGRRQRTNGTDLRRSLGALARADVVLKTSPEPVHRVTLERLTVALCRWLGG